MTELVNMANDYIEKCYGVPYGESIALQPVNHKDVYDAFIYAYEQGAKDINVLTKENAELKAEEKIVNNNNIDLMKANQKLVEKCCIYKAQIEKMKCCENCKFWVDNDCTIDHDYDCMRWNNHNTDDFWECAE